MTAAPSGTPASARIQLEGMTPVVHSYARVRAVGNKAAMSRRRALAADGVVRAGRSEIRSAVTAAPT